MSFWKSFGIPCKTFNYHHSSTFYVAFNAKSCFCLRIKTSSDWGMSWWVGLNRKKMDNFNSSEYKYSFVTEVFMIIYQTVDQKVLKIGSWTKYNVLKFNSCTQFQFNIKSKRQKRNVYWNSLHYHWFAWIEWRISGWCIMPSDLFIEESI